MHLDVNLCPEREMHNFKGNIPFHFIAMLCYAMLPHCVKPPQHQLRVHPRSPISIPIPTISRHESLHALLIAPWMASDPGHAMRTRYTWLIAPWMASLPAVAPAPKMAALPNFLPTFLSHSPCWGSCQRAVNGRACGGGLGGGVNCKVTFGCWGWAGWLGSEGGSVSELYHGESGGEGYSTFCVLGLLLSGLGLFFGVGHLDEVDVVYSCLVVYGCIGTFEVIVV